MRLLILSILITLSYSCSDNKTAEKKTPPPPLPLHEQIELKKASELASGVVNDTVILDHVFGMSKKEVYKHKNKIFKEKRIYGIYKTKNTRIFAYDIKTKNFDKLTLYFDAYFHNDEMYRMECKPKLKKKDDVATVQSDLIELYKIKYGEPHFMIPQDTVLNFNTALWVNGNLTIEIERDEEHVVVAYTDMKRELDMVDDI